MVNYVKERSGVILNTIYEIGCYIGDSTEIKENKNIKKRRKKW